MKYTWCRLGFVAATFVEDVDYCFQDVDVESEKFGGDSVLLRQGE